MGYEIVRRPFMLMETVAMIYKYVNNIPFQSAISRQRFFMNNADYAERSRIMARLQQIKTWSLPSPGTRIAPRISSCRSRPCAFPGSSR